VNLIDAAESRPSLACSTPADAALSARFVKPQARAARGCGANLGSHQLARNTIVFVHAFVLAAGWTPQLRDLSDRCRVLAPDLPGHVKHQDRPAWIERCSPPRESRVRAGRRRGFPRRYGKPTFLGALHDTFGSSLPYLAGSATNPSALLLRHRPPGVQQVAFDPGTPARRFMS
jgi:pimeloyl-ACP methyl ester carboxylesterase